MKFRPLKILKAWEMTTIRKILIINIFGIGDVLFTTPLISSLKAYSPRFSIGYLCNRRTAPLLERNPQIDKIFVYERDEWQELWRRSKFSYLKRLGQFIKELRKERYEMVIDVSLNSFMSFLTWRAGIPQRIGFNYKNRSLFLTQEIPLEGYQEKHIVEYYQDILKRLDIPTDIKELQLEIGPEELTWRENFLKEKGIPADKLLIGIVPGGGDSWGKEAIYKRWPVAQYAKLADKLIEKFPAEIILMGGRNELGICSQTAQLMRRRSFMACGETTLPQFASLAAYCGVVVLNDGGPLHLAVAARAKTVSIFGPVDDQIYGPYPKSEDHQVVKKDLACRPCYRQFRKASCEHISCLNSIEVEDVFQKVETILQRKSSK